MRNILRFLFILTISLHCGARAAERDSTWSDKAASCKDDKGKFFLLRLYVRELPRTVEAFYPSQHEIARLAQIFRLTNKQVNGAFVNARSRLGMSVKKKTNKKLAKVADAWLQGASLYLLPKPPKSHEEIPALVLDEDGILYKYYMSAFDNHILVKILYDFDPAYAPTLIPKNFSGEKMPLPVKDCEYLNALGARIVLGRNLNDPYPSARECETLAFLSDSEVSQVKDWFTNFRKRKLPGLRAKKRERRPIKQERFLVPKIEKVELADVKPKARQIPAPNYIYQKYLEPSACQEWEKYLNF